MRINLVTITRGSNSYYIADANPVMPSELAKRLHNTPYDGEFGYYSGSKKILGSVCRVNGFVMGQEPDAVRYWHIDTWEALEKFVEFVMKHSTSTEWLVEKKPKFTTADLAMAIYYGGNLEALCNYEFESEEIKYDAETLRLAQLGIKAHQDSISALAKKYPYGESND